MTIKRTLVPVMMGLRGAYFVAENIEISSPAVADALGFGYKIKSIEFDDLTFDTPNPILPLWYRILLWFRREGY
jgi:hypothetical protein